MNERIRQLAVEADGVFIHKLITGAKQYTFLEKDLEKFAELIVRECIQIGGPEDSYTDEWFKAKADSVAKIKKHFGVEE